MATFLVASILLIQSTTLISCSPVTEYEGIPEGHGWNDDYDFLMDTQIPNDFGPFQLGSNTESFDNGPGVSFVKIEDGGSGAPIISQGQESHPELVEQLLSNLFQGLGNSMGSFPQNLHQFHEFNPHGFPGAPQPNPLVSFPEFPFGSGMPLPPFGGQPPGAELPNWSTMQSITFGGSPAQTPELSFSSSMPSESGSYSEFPHKFRIISSVSSSHTIDNKPVTSPASLETPSQNLQYGNPQSPIQIEGKQKEQREDANQKDGSGIATAQLNAGDKSSNETERESTTAKVQIKDTLLGPAMNITTLTSNADMSKNEIDSKESDTEQETEGEDPPKMTSASPFETQSADTPTESPRYTCIHKSGSVMIVREEGPSSNTDSEDPNFDFLAVSKVCQEDSSPWAYLEGNKGAHSRNYKGADMHHENGAYVTPHNGDNYHVSPSGVLEHPQIIVLRNIGPNAEVDVHNFDLRPAPGHDMSNSAGHNSGFENLRDAASNQAGSDTTEDVEAPGGAQASVQVVPSGSQGVRFPPHYSYGLPGSPSARKYFPRLSSGIPFNYLNALARNDAHFQKIRDLLNK